MTIYSKNRLDMAKNILLFNTVQEYEQKRNNDYVEPWVSYTKESGELSLNKSEEEKLFSTPLTFEITGDGDIKWSPFLAGQYKKNNGEWVTCSSTIPVVAGDVVQFMGDNPRDVMGAFTGTTCEFKLSGNIMSLIKSIGFENDTVLVSAQTFYNLFSNCTGLTDASKLLLPATALTESCYSSMFDTCNNLTVAPVLPATTLVTSCYRRMFWNCSSLSSAPELPAATLVDSCYYQMFANCRSLNYIKCLATSGISARSCGNWVSNVSSSGTFVKDASATWSYGNSGIPSNWTVEDA